MTASVWSRTASWSREATLEELRHGTRIKLRAAPLAKARELLEALEESVKSNP